MFNMFKWYHFSTLGICYIMLATAHLALKINIYNMYWIFGFIGFHLAYMAYTAATSYNWTLNYNDTSTMTEYFFNPLNGKVKGFSKFDKDWVTLADNDANLAMESNIALSMMLMVIVNMFFSILYFSIVFGSQLTR